MPCRRPFGFDRRVAANVARGERCARIPACALWPDGTPCATTIFFKCLSG